MTPEKKGVQGLLTKRMDRQPDVKITAGVAEGGQGEVAEIGGL